MQCAAHGTPLQRLLHEKSLRESGSTLLREHVRRDDGAISNSTPTLPGLFWNEAIQIQFPICAEAHATPRQWNCARNYTNLANPENVSGVTPRHSNSIGWTRHATPIPIGNGNSNPRPIPPDQAESLHSTPRQFSQFCVEWRGMAWRGIGFIVAWLILVVFSIDLP